MFDCQIIRKVGGNSIWLKEKILNRDEAVEDGRYIQQKIYCFGYEGKILDDIAPFEK